MKINLSAVPAGAAWPRWATAFLLLCLLNPPATRAASAPELLEQGIYTEETKGDLAEAIRLYREVSADPAADRSLVAQAQLRVGLCELKLGHKPEATSALEQLTRQFPDQEQLLTMVENRLPRLLDEILRQIEENYVQKVDRQELMQTAIRAMIGKLDSRAALLGTNEMAEIHSSIEQKIAGIGAQLRRDDTTGEVIVETPLAGSPAFKGGVRPGDRLVSVDGRELPQEKPLEAAVKWLRGPAGAPVEVGLRHAGAEEVVKLKLVRDSVMLPSVLGDRYKPDRTWEFMADDTRKIGYVRISHVGKQTPNEMESALKDLASRGMKGLILDLRNNPGGLLQEAVAVTDLFVEQGRIVTVKGRAGEEIYDAKPEGTYLGFPIALLANRNTASAAEIIVAGLQDHHRAVVVGERTHGEGLVKSLVRLRNDLGTLRLPVAAYYRPSGRAMHRYPESKDEDDWGVIPDPGFAVDLEPGELKSYEKYRAERDKLDPTQTVPPATTFQDRPFIKAWDYLLAQTNQK